MTPSRLGIVTPVVRRIPGAEDPLCWYRAVSADGAVPHTQLLESADHTPGGTTRSLIGVRAAVHLTADRTTVTLVPTSANGPAVIAWLAERRPDGQTDSAGVFRLAIPAGAPVPAERDRFRQPSPLDVVRELVGQIQLDGAPARWCHLLIGTIGYDAIDYFETLPAGPDPEAEAPRVEFWLPDRLVVIDHSRDTTTLIATTWSGPGDEYRRHDASADLAALVELGSGLPANLTQRRPDGGRPEAPAVDQDDPAFEAVVTELAEHLRAGDGYQVVASRTFTLPCPEPLAAYGILRAANPSPYLFFLNGPDTVLFGASPETCLRVDGPTRRATIVPIAGTVPRGRRPDGTIDPDLDTRYEVALRSDPKELAEHLMLVDLARNDLARISMPGTRSVTRLLDVERYSHVMHLVSEVTGVLRDGVDAIEAYAATMPMGTLVGAPKLEAAALLRRVEPARRGYYGGAVGYLLSDGSLETAIVIRSAVVRDGVASIRAGAGIVLDSIPANEAAETRRKAAAVIGAIQAAAPEVAHA